MVSKKRKYKRKQQGFSLVSVLLIALTAVLVMHALASSFIPMFRTLGTERTRLNVRAASESATNYLIAKLNNPVSQPDFDCGPIYGTTKVLPLSATLLGLSDESYKITAVISNVVPVPPSGTLASGFETGTVQNISTSFDPTLQNFQNSDLVPVNSAAEKKWSMFSTLQNPWRQLSVKVEGPSGIKTRIVTLLRPAFYADSMNSTPTNSYFSNALTGTDLIALGQGTQTMAYSALDKQNVPSQGKVQGTEDLVNTSGNVAARGFVSISAGSEIGGNLKIEGNNYKNSNALYSASSTGGTINQTLEFPGQQQGFELNNNVLNASETGTYPSASDAFKATNGSSITPLPPSLSPPSTSGVSALNSYAPNSNATLIGDSTASTLSIPSNVSVSTLSPSTSTRIFIQNAPNNYLAPENPQLDVQNVADIRGGVNRGGDPANFQIWYNGTGILNINGAEINATIYAPNAKVAIRNSQVYGSIVASQIAGTYDIYGKVLEPVKNTKFHFYKPLSDASKLGYSPIDYLNVSHWQAESFREFEGKQAD